MAVVAIGGNTSSGARFLGPELSRVIGADYVDRLILANVAREVQSTVEALHQREERPPSRGERFTRVLQRFLERSAVSGYGGDPYFGAGYPDFLVSEYEDIPQQTITRGHEMDDQVYIDAIRKVIEGLADNGNVVIVGRGAHLILRERKDVLRIGCVAKLADRIERTIARENLTPEQGAKTVLARDKAQAFFFKRFFNVDNPDDPEHYHMTINTSEINLEKATALIAKAAKDLDDGVLGYP